MATPRPNAYKLAPFDTPSRNVAVFATPPQRVGHERLLALLRSMPGKTRCDAIPGLVNSLGIGAVFETSEQAEAAIKAARELVQSDPHLWKDTFINVLSVPEIVPRR